MGLGIEMAKYFFISFGVAGLKTARNRLFLAPVLLLAVIYSVYSDSYLLTLQIMLPLIVILMIKDIGVKKYIQLYVMEFVAISFVDLLMWLIIVGGTAWGNHYVANSALINTAGNMAGLFFWIVLSFALRKKRALIAETIYNMTTKQMVIILAGIGLMSVITACIQGLFLHEITVSAQRLAMLASVAFCIFIIVLCGLFVFVSDSRKKLMEINRLNTECMAYQKGYYEEIMKKDDELRAFRHDVRKHYRVITMLINEGNYDEARNYVNALEKYEETGDIYKTGNVVADYIINGKIKKLLQAMDVEVAVIGKFPADMSIDTTDLCIILANALDNAEEALREYDGKKILEIHIKNWKGRLYITIKNSSYPRDTEHMNTTKRDSQSHGFGLKNIQRAVLGCGGSVEAGCEENVFTLEIIL